MDEVNNDPNPNLRENLPMNQNGEQEILQRERHQQEERLAEAQIQQQMGRNPNHLDDDDFFLNEPERYIPHLFMTPCVIMLFIVWHSFRTHMQLYPTILHLTTSKLSFCTFGLSVCAVALSFFQYMSKLFLGPLRVAEQEAVADGIRWGLTETCLALTMFRDDLSSKMGMMFITLVGAKCWHWVIEMRGKHLINTQEAFYVDEKSGIPKFYWEHARFWFFTTFLFFADLAAVYYCAMECAENGPSVHILFGFEAAILNVMAGSTLGLYHLHVLDGFLSALVQLKHLKKEETLDNQEHRETNVTETIEETVINEEHDDERIENNSNDTNINNDDSNSSQNKSSDSSMSGIEHLYLQWREKRGTYALTLDLVAQAAQFSCYLLFFAIVLTYYGLPINIFRQLYVTFQLLRKKMIAFVSYWRLSRLLDTKFETVDFTKINGEDEEDSTCIICRDQMTLGKRLPGCGHVFHTHCLKGWLMQQHTCPTCRSDICAAAARVEVMDRNNRNGNDDPDAENDDRSNNNEISVESEGQEVTINGIDENTDGSEPSGNKKPISSIKPNTNKKEESQLSSRTALDTRVSCNDHDVFPCFYRVKSSEGAHVYSLSSSSPPTTKEKDPAIMSQNLENLKRTVPPKKIILCTDMKYFNQHIMLRMPDGWVKEKDVMRMMPLPKLMSNTTS